MAECPDSTPTKSIERVCVSPSLKEQICLLCAKVVSNSDFRRKLTTSGGQKTTKTYLTLESTLGQEISSDCFLTNILCRNCGIYLVFYLPHNYNNYLKMPKEKKNVGRDGEEA